MNKLVSLADDPAVLRRLADDFTAFLSDWANGKSDICIAEEISSKKDEIDRHKNSTAAKRYKYDWTAAEYIYFKKLAEEPTRLGLSRRSWRLYPEVRPYAGEFLADFSIREDSYGLRIACESQWSEGANNCGRVAYAFDKLLHIKADIKIMVFEEGHETTNILNHLRNLYMNGYVEFHRRESYLLMQWQENLVRCYEWHPLDRPEVALIEQETL
jgi:hypothetical protein